MAVWPLILEKLSYMSHMKMWKQPEEKKEQSCDNIDSLYLSNSHILPQ